MCLILCVMVDDGEGSKKKKKKKVIPVVQCVRSEVPDCELGP